MFWCFNKRNDNHWYARRRTKNVPPIILNPPGMSILIDLLLSQISMYISLALFGLLFAGAYCGENDFDAVVLNSNLFGDQPADNSQYWWMSKGSPFKRAVAAGPPQQQFDFAANPFLRSKSHPSIYFPLSLQSLINLPQCKWSSIFGNASISRFAHIHDNDYF